MSADHTAPHDMILEVDEAHSDREDRPRQGLVFERDDTSGEHAEVEVSVLMPCLNEEASVADCVEEARKALADMGAEGEVIVVDNGSTDASAHAADSAGARVVFTGERGYGNAYLQAFREARGQYLVMGDADGTYDFGEISSFVEPLRSDVDMVMGSRIRGEIEPGAMPWIHRYVGTPLFAALIRLFFGARISDVHCGMRSLSRAAYERIHLSSPGMELASELIIEAARVGLRVKEVPIRYRTRSGGETKLRTWADGWRHLRLILSRTVTTRISAAGDPEGDAAALGAEQQALR